MSLQLFKIFLTLELNLQGTVADTRACNLAFHEKKRAHGSLVQTLLASFLFLICSRQGGRSCTGAREVPAEILDSDENFKPEHMLFCRELRFVAIYALFGDLWAK